MKTQDHIFYAPFTGSEARCPPINLLSQNGWCRENIFSRLIAHTYVYEVFVIQSLSQVKRVVSTETRVSLKRRNISVVAYGRRTERGDKERDKCECRRGTEG